MYHPDVVTFNQRALLLRNESALDARVRFICNPSRFSVASENLRSSVVRRVLVRARVPSDRTIGHFRFVSSDLYVNFVTHCLIGSFDGDLCRSRYVYCRSNFALSS